MNEYFESPLVRPLNPFYRWPQTMPPIVMVYMHGEFCEFYRQITNRADGRSGFLYWCIETGKLMVAGLAEDEPKRYKFSRHSC